MKRLIGPIGSIVLLAVLTTTAPGQADAQRAYQEAKTAFQAQKFAEARDLAKKA